MKAALIMIIPALVAAAAADASSRPIRVAVLEFKSDQAVDAYLAIKGSGARLAALVSNDLSVLPPLAVVPEEDVARKVSPAIQEPSDTLTPAQAKSAGEATGATNLVCGRIYRTGAGVVFAAKIVSTETGEALGAMVQFGAGDALADALSALAIQIGAIAISQQGLEAPHWADARISGTHVTGGISPYGAVACVRSVDSRRIADEIHNWNRDQALKPGLHDIFVRYYDGTGSAGHGFVIDAKPGAVYEARFERDGDHNPKLWIQERGSQKPATPIYVAAIVGPHEWYEDYSGLNPPNAEPYDRMHAQPSSGARR
jgi:hypothetical protein